MWRAIPGFPGYAISKSGKAKRTAPGPGTWPGRQLKRRHHRFGYAQYRMIVDGKRRRPEAYVLVALAWIGPKPSPNHEVAHLDGDCTNGHYQNLAWVTHKENESHKRRHGTSLLGERNPMAILTEARVRLIRRDKQLNPSLSLAMLEKRHNVDWRQIGRIIQRKAWAHV